MCGRFSQADLAALDREIFKLLEVVSVPARYNVAPGQPAAVIRDTGAGRRLELLRWGLIPSWAHDPKIGFRTINARRESLATKPAFRDAFRYRRCLVPVDGFYEWRKTPHGKEPYFVRSQSGEPLLLAGLWDRWLSHDEGPVETFTIITTPPNALIAPLHDRMPAILRPEVWDRWLDPAEQQVARLEPLLEPFPADGLTAYRVSTYVNDANHEGARCIEPVGA